MYSLLWSDTFLFHASKTSHYLLSVKEAQRKAKAEKQQVPAEIKLKTSPAAKATKSNEAAKKVDSGKKSTRWVKKQQHLNLIHV